MHLGEGLASDLSVAGAGEPLRGVLGEVGVDRFPSRLKGLAGEKGFDLADSVEDDVLIYAQFPQIGLKFLENRGNPDAFEPVPTIEEAAESPANQVVDAVPASGPEAYHISVNGVGYDVVVSPGGEVTDIQPAAMQAASAAPVAPAGGGETVPSPLAGTIYKVNVSPGEAVNEGDVVMVLEAMKMETEVRAPVSGSVGSINVKEGDTVQVGDALMVIS